MTTFASTLLFFRGGAGLGLCSSSSSVEESSTIFLRFLGEDLTETVGLMREPDAAGDCRVPADKGGESAVDLRVERVVDVVEALVERLAALAEVEALFLLVAAATGSDGTSTSRELRTYWLSSSPPASSSALVLSSRRR